MRSLNAVIISGACCNPVLKSIDEKIEDRVRRLAKEERITLELSSISISNIALGGAGLDMEVNDNLRSLISSKGMSVLPIVFLNKQMVSYGGVPSEETLRNKILEVTNNIIK